MSKTSDKTKHYRKWKWIFFILSLLLTFGPIIFTFASALFEEGVLHQKFALTTSLFICIIFTVISVFLKYKPHSLPWIILFGAWVLLDNLLATVLIFGICNIVDEFIVSPLYKHFAISLKINKNLDDRL